MEYFEKLIKYLAEEKPNKEKFGRFKRKLADEYSLGYVPTDIEILMSMSAKDYSLLKPFLLTKPTRSLSGVAVVAIMTSPAKCPHGKCIMCPGGVDSDFGTVPQSYTGFEPATRRAIRNNYDPYLQVMNRLEQYMVQGHNAEKVELIIMGGTFPARTKRYQRQFVKYAFKAMNDFSHLFYRNGEFEYIKFKKFFMLPRRVDDKRREKIVCERLLLEKRKREDNLKREQKRNENSSVRCVGLTVETRPDFAIKEHVKELLALGCTRVELGVQSVYDKALKSIERGHTVRDTIDATKILKDSGYKINYHMMPGLPSVTKKEDINGLKEIFDNENFRPDMLKIYPVMVLAGTKLHKLWKNGKYTPLTTTEAAQIILKFKEHVPEYVRIMRIQRDIPTNQIAQGVDMTNLRQLVFKSMGENGTRCRCIRCREAGRSKINLTQAKINVKEYNASGGREFFISAESGDAIVGFARLRITDDAITTKMKRVGFIRELHVYGHALGLGKRGDLQHRGVGKRLMEVAEIQVKKEGIKDVFVISAVGTRQYYRKIGYKRKGYYMYKSLRK